VCLDTGLGPCAAHDECCSGYCRAVNAGGLYCQDCIGEGGSCIVPGTNPAYYYCCPGLWCDASSGQCVPQPNPCSCGAEPCSSDGDCCEGYFCTAEGPSMGACSGSGACRYCGGSIYPPCQ
jgi:hypothetical protein